MSKTYVTRPALPPYEEYCREIRDLWESRFITNMGKKSRKLKEALQPWLGTDLVEVTVNGHSAIELAIQAFGLRGEIITTPFTFVSTANAIIRCGLTPVFCDIDPETWTIDPGKIEALITPKTSAILPVHVFGNVCRMEDIQEIAGRHHLKVIYDAAHAFAVQWNGRGIGAFGDASCFSFHATKVFNSVEGGAACFRDPEVLRRFSHLQNFGIADAEALDGIGPNAKMNEFAAAMGLCNLSRLQENLRLREAIDEAYREKLASVPGLRLPPVQPQAVRNFGYFPILLDPERFGATRDDVFSALKTVDIHTRKYFYPLVSDLIRPFFDAPRTETPAARKISESVLPLPIYQDLPEETVDRICDTILALHRRAV